MTRYGDYLNASRAAPPPLGPGLAHGNVQSGSQANGAPYVGPQTGPPNRQQFGYPSGLHALLQPTDTLGFGDHVDSNPGPRLGVSNQLTSQLRLPTQGSRLPEISRITFPSIIPKLGTNLLMNVWVRKVHGILRRLGLDNVIDSQIPRPSRQDANYAKWKYWSFTVGRWLLGQVDAGVIGNLRAFDLVTEETFTKEPPFYADETFSRIQSSELFQEMGYASNDLHSIRREDFPTAASYVIAWMQAVQIATDLSLSVSPFTALMKFNAIRDEVPESRHLLNGILWGGKAAHQITHNEFLMCCVRLLAMCHRAEREARMAAQKQPDEGQTVNRLTAENLEATNLEPANLAAENPTAANLAADQAEPGTLSAATIVDELTSENADAEAEGQGVQVNHPHAPMDTTDDVATPATNKPLDEASRTVPRMIPVHKSGFQKDPREQEAAASSSRAHKRKLSSTSIGEKLGSVGPQLPV